MAMQTANTAVCQCSFGAAPASLPVPPACKVLACGLPAATVMDNKLPPFGMCSSLANPAVSAATAAAGGVLTPQLLPGADRPLDAGLPHGADRRQKRAEQYQQADVRLWRGDPGGFPHGHNGGHSLICGGNGSPRGSGKRNPPAARPSGRRKPWRWARWPTESWMRPIRTNGN